MSSAPLTDVELSPPGVAAVGRTQAREWSLHRTWPWILVATDATMILAGSLLAAYEAPRAGASPLSVGWMVAFTLLAVMLVWVAGLYRGRIQPRLLDDTAAMLGLLTVTAALVLSAQVLAEAGEGRAMLRVWAFAAVYALAGRAALNWSAVNARRAGFVVRPTLIVGCGRIGTLLARRLLARPELGLKPVAFLDKEPDPDIEGLPDVPVVGASWDLDRVIDELGIEQILVAFSTAPDTVLLRVLRRAEEREIPVAFVPRFFERVPQGVVVEHLGGISLLIPRPVRTRGWQFAVKYAVDRTLATLLLVLALPIFGAAALAVVLTMGRPVFFRQTRVGRDGKPFKMLKFRSMHKTSARVDFVLPDGLGPGGIEGVDRTTPVGRMLRISNVDELPQLVNVLRGEMSIVGPRPERPEFVSRFEQSVYRYGDRHRVKAGITGWAQVHGLRGRTSIADRAEWDNFYIENFSLWLDLKILLMTAATVARGLLPRFS